MTSEFAQQLGAYAEAAGFTTQPGSLATDSGVGEEIISGLLTGNENATPVVAGALLHSLRVPGEHRAEFLLLAAGHDATSLRTTIGRVPRTREEILAEAREQERGKTLGEAWAGFAARSVRIAHGIEPES